jgi:ribonuclease HI
MTEYNKVQLIWLPGHKGIGDNETADFLTKQGAETPFVGPELACGMSGGAVGGPSRYWKTINHLEH